MKVEIAGPRNAALWKAEIRQAAKAAFLKQVGHLKGEVFIKLVDEAEIKALNRATRGQDTVTDVLSFPVNHFTRHEGKPLLNGNYVVGDHGILLGDVVICIPRALSQAEEYGHEPRREMAYLTVHALLHLLGYDHDNETAKKVMRTEEEHILTTLNLTRE